MPGFNRSYIARLNADGSLDATFNPGTAIGGTTPVVYSVAVQLNGQVLIAGQFTSANGNHTARLHGGGSLPGQVSQLGADNAVRAIAIAPDGLLVVGWRLQRVQGARNFSISQQGSADRPGWRPLSSFMGVCARESQPYNVWEMAGSLAGKESASGPPVWSKSLALRHCVCSPACGVPKPRWCTNGRHHAGRPMARLPTWTGLGGGDVGQLLFISRGGRILKCSRAATASWTSST